MNNDCINSRENARTAEYTKRKNDGRRRENVYYRMKKVHTSYIICISTVTL